MRRMKRAVVADPLELGGVCRSKHQIDALEKMLMNGMPPRVLLENSFSGLRCVVADEMEQAQGQQWARGVRHGEQLNNSRIAVLEQMLHDQRQMYARLQTDYTKLLTENQNDWIRGGLMPLQEMPFARLPDDDDEATLDLEVMSREVDAL